MKILPSPATRVALVLGLALGGRLRADPPSFPAGTDLYFGIVPPASGTAAAAGAPPIDLDSVTIRGRAANLVGRADTASSGRVGPTDIAERPLLRPAELLEAVPGLLVTQHSGDGKANQYFTRGFNLDHGTDFAISLDGIPVNLPSHAHGEGYTDLNFVIPELVRSVTYTKGPFDAEEGDFATAGSADLIYPDTLPFHIASLSMGEFGYARALAAYPMSLWGGDMIYALEIGAYDGPWAVAEGFRKFNGFIRYSRGPADQRWALSYAAYHGSWNATNQVPQDAVDQGLINAFGSLSPTDGGEQDRQLLWGTWKARGGRGELDALAYAERSHLDLWSDFTFDLPYQASGAQLDQGLAQDRFANPGATGGEQFQQREDRVREGGTLRYLYQAPLGAFPTENEAGVDLRNDNALVGLYNTDQRVAYETDSLHRVVESGAAVYVRNAIRWTPWLRSVLAYRQDYYWIQVSNQTPAVQDGVDLLAATGPTGPNNELAPLSAFAGGTAVGATASYQATQPQPKAALIVRPAEGPLELYLNYGRGFHSNDARGLTSGADLLAQADSEELGLRYAHGDAYETGFSAWRMDMASEQTFNGDTSRSSPNGASTRQGLEWSNTMRIRPFYVDLDAALSQARFLSVDTVDNPPHPGDWVPEAIEQAATLTLGMDKVVGWSLDARLRYFGARALTPDDQVRSQPSVLCSLRVMRHLWAGQTVSVDVFNVFNQAVDDVSYDYAYAYPGIQGGQAHPMVLGHATEPRSIRVTWTDTL